MSANNSQCVSVLSVNFNLTFISGKLFGSSLYSGCKNSFNVVDLIIICCNFPATVLFSWPEVAFGICNTLHSLGSCAITYTYIINLFVVFCKK
jgi:hypothetical protein